MGTLKNEIELSQHILRCIKAVVVSGNSSKKRFFARTIRSIDQ
jgi:hypothetical protein